MSDLHINIENWINSQFDENISGLGDDKYVVVRSDNKFLKNKQIWVIKYIKSTIIFSQNKWVSDLEHFITNMDKEMLFSIYGAFELGRVLSKDKIRINGPSYYLFGDRDNCNLEVDPRAFVASREEMESLDKEIFWHCDIDNAVSGLAVKNNGQISALATIVDEGEGVYEIGMEVHRDSQGLGMGKAVVNAAVQWILNVGGIPLATVGPFNVPSARTLRSVGLKYYMMDMSGEFGEFIVPPQALGTPVKNMDIYNLYPDWAMNNLIKSKIR